VKRFPESDKIMDAMYALAISHQNRGDFAAESKIWQQIIKYNNSIDPKLVQEAYYRLGICQEKLGNIDFALKSYDTASKEGPNTSIMSSALLSVGGLYEKQHLDSRAALVYRLVMQKFPQEKAAQEAANKLGNLNLEYLLSEYQTIYRVKKGDNLTAIAKRFDTTIDTIMKSNRLSDTSIKIGMELEVPRVRFSIDVGIEDKLAYLICDGYIVKRYRIATSATDTSALTGDVSIGQFVSDGSIRLRDEDIEELFDLMSLKDTVRITQNLESRLWYSWVDDINNGYNNITSKNRRDLISQKN
jgi:LysM repeat protein